jgi:thiaminase
LLHSCYTVVTCREDAFQEYVELETVYLDTLEAAAAATAAATTPAEAAAAAVRDAADFGKRRACVSIVVSIACV